MAAFNVPFVSQQVYANPQRRRFGCGIASLKMVLDYWHEQDQANLTDEAELLYASGLAAGAFNPEFGWLHAGLAGLAAAHGYLAYNLDFGPKSRSPLRGDQALAELTAELAAGPVIASAFRDFDPVQGGGHLVVVTGISGDAISLNDPEPDDELRGRRLLTQRDFLRGFKHRFIVVRPSGRTEPARGH